MSYPESLSRELARHGIGGDLRQRIITEIQDHLACDPDADMGDPTVLAAQFADELGCARARRAGFAAFGALGVAGVLFAIAFLIAGSGFPHRHPRSELLGEIAVALMALGSQVALVAGTLAALRAFRRRGARVMPRAEAIILARRAAVGLTAGFASMAGLALLAIEYDHSLPSSSTTFALIAAAAGACPLVAATPALFSASRLRPIAAGSAGDLFDDFGKLIPTALRGRHWRFAVTVAFGVAVVITAAGVMQSDGYDGAMRGLADAIACLAGFAVLGRYLGLRPARS